MSSVLMTYSKVESDNSSPKELLLSYIKEDKIIPHYQPIVDLYSGEVHGFEVLSRAPEPFTDTGRMFELAHEWGISWELEQACRNKAVEDIAKLGSEFRSKRFFINVSPHIFSDARFNMGAKNKELGALGLQAENIVIEITEITSVENYDKFEKLISYFVGQGFNVALDDFGAGHSGLLTLVAVTPHYLKIDRGLISGISENNYKQKLVNAIGTFAGSVETTLIAEGIETEDELTTVYRMGARFGQGFLLGRPKRNPEFLSADVLELLSDHVKRKNRTRYSVDDSISRMVTRPVTYDSQSITCGELDRVLHKNHSIEHVVILKDNKPSGQLTRRHFYNILGVQHGYSVFQRKYADTIAKSEMLIVNQYLDLRTMG